MGQIGPSRSTVKAPEFWEVDGDQTANEENGEDQADPDPQGSWARGWWLVTDTRCRDCGVHRYGGNLRVFEK